MSDEDEEGGVPFNLGGFFGVAHTPQELVEHLKDRQARQEIEISAETHQRLNLIETLDRTTMEYMKSLVGHIGSMGDTTPATASAFHDGFFTALLWMKFGVCPSCDVIHEDQLLDQIGDEA